MGIYLGDCLEVLRSFKSNSLDALVTDPPAGKGGRDSWIEWMTSVMAEALRVLKPGAHGFVWALPRTSHWTATALENAGFEVLGVVTHLFGTDWGALRSASEHWVLVCKPLSESTIAANVLKWGTGGLSFDASRIESLDVQSFAEASRFYYVGKARRPKLNTHPTVKSLKLMEYLIKLVTPPQGTVLDPFMGSGSTGVAAKQLRFKFIGIEQVTEYFEIARARLDAVE